MFNPSIDGYIRMPKVWSESWGAGSLPNPLSPASDGPSSEPCASRACGHWRLPCPTDGEAYLEIAHLFRSYPKGLRQSCPWEDSISWAARRHRRKAGTSEFPEPWPSFPALRWSEQYDYFRREKCKGVRAPSAFRCRLERDSFLRGVREVGRL